MVEVGDNQMKRFVGKAAGLEISATMNGHAEVGENGTHRGNGIVILRDQECLKIHGLCLPSLGPTRHGSPHRNSWGKGLGVGTRCGRLGLRVFADFAENRRVFLVRQQRRDLAERLFRCLQ